MKPLITPKSADEGILITKGSPTATQSDGMGTDEVATPDYLPEVRFEDSNAHRVFTSTKFFRSTMANISQIVVGFNSYNTDIHVSDKDDSIDENRDIQHAMGYNPHFDEVISSDDISIANGHFSSTPKEPDPGPNFSVAGSQHKKGFTFVTHCKHHKGRLFYVPIHMYIIFYYSI